MITPDLKNSILVSAKQLWPDSSAEQLRYYQEEVAAYLDIEHRREEASNDYRRNSIFLKENPDLFDEDFELDNDVEIFELDYSHASTESPNSFLGQLNILRAIQQSRADFYNYDDSFTPKALIENFRREVLNTVPAEDRSWAGYKELLKLLKDKIADWRLENLDAEPRF